MSIKEIIQTIIRMISLTAVFEILLMNGFSFGSWQVWAIYSLFVFNMLVDEFTIRR